MVHFFGCTLSNKNVKNPIPAFLRISEEIMCIRIFSDGIVVVFLQITIISWDGALLYVSKFNVLKMIYMWALYVCLCVFVALCIILEKKRKRQILWEKVTKFDFPAAGKKQTYSMFKYKGRKCFFYYFFGIFCQYEEHRNGK